MRRSLAVVGGTLLAVGLTLGACSQMQDQLPAAPSPQPVTTVAPASPSPSLSSVPVQPIETPATETLAPSAAPTPVQPASDAVPAWLSIPAIGIDESIVPQGLNAKGVLEPPKDHTIWYDGSPKPGQNGTSVVAGHVQWGSTPDNFWRLNEIPAGSSVTITYSDGTATQWVTVGDPISQLKEDLQRNPAIWGESDTPYLALITCDKNSRVVSGHFVSNVAVLAVPA